MKLEVYNQDPKDNEKQIITKQNAQVEYLKNNVTPSNYTMSRTHPHEKFMNNMKEQLDINPDFLDMNKNFYYYPILSLEDNEKLNNRERSHRLNCMWL